MKKIYIVLILLFGYVWLNAQVSNQTEARVEYPDDNYISMDYYNTTTGHYINDGTTYILYDWHNDGIVSFTAGENTGLTMYIGNSIQNLTGTGLSNYFNVLFNNTFTNASIQLQKEVNVYGTSDYFDGIVEETGNGLMVFQDNANHINTSDISFVDGKVRKIGDDAFIFPIGDDNGIGTFLYRFASISAPNVVTDIYDAQYFWKTTNDIHPIATKESIIEAIDETEYWIIDETNGTSNADITLSWHSTEVTTSPNTILDDFSKLVIVRWNGTQWINEGGVVNSSGNTVTTTPTGYGTFTFGRVYIDSDGDGVTDEQEVTDGTDPNDNCSFVLANQVVDPDDTWNNADCDEDGITNAAEKTAGTDPLDPCSNTYATGDEVCQYVTANPTSIFALADCDGGGVDNITECNRGTNPISSIDDPNPIVDNNQSYVNIETSGNLSVNDRDILNGATYGTAVADINNPENTLPVINSDGTYTFTGILPGKYVFVIPITMPNGDVVYTTLIINIIDPDIDDNSPVANTDIGSTLEGDPITMPVLSNDRSGNISIDLDETSISIIDNPSNGVGVVDPVTGDITYTPNAGFIGKDTLEYKVLDTDGNEATAFFIITVLSQNAENTTMASDDYYSTSINITINGDVLVNDSDPEGDSQIAQPQDETLAGVGHFQLFSDGTFNFAPEPGFVGPVNFKYSIIDNNPNPDTSYASLYILVQSVYAQIGDFVWEDLDGNGRQDSGEPGIEGVVVDLIPIGSFTTTKHATTDNAGKYLFEDVKDGKYYLKFHIASNYEYTIENVGGDGLDSDVDGSNGYGTTISFNASKNNNQFHWDAGVYRCTQIGDLAWFDINMNDVYDSDETGVNGMRVELYRLQNGNWVLWDIDYTGINSNSVCGDGYYTFCTNPGTYYLYFALPPIGLVPAQAHIGNDQEIDCDITRAHGYGTTDDFTITSGQTSNFTIDAGFYDMSMVTNSLAWIDDNSNGTKDEEESGVPNMLVEIFDINGNLYSSTHTDVDGKYYIDYLQAEDYYLKFQIPSAYPGYGFTTSNQGDDDTDSDVTNVYGFGTTDLFNLAPDEEKQHQDAGIHQGTLPLNTLFVGAEWKDDKVLVKWLTSNELNVENFIVQRAFENGESFSDIGTVKAKGEKTNSYEYNDISDFKNGIYYYRIVGVDYDGRTTVSKVVVVFVSNSKDINLELYPNPTVNSAIISFDVMKNSEVKIDVFDIAGKRVLDNIVNDKFEIGKYKVDIDVRTLDAATYYLRFVSDDIITFKKLIVLGK